MATLGGQLGLLALITHSCLVEDMRSSSIEANRGCKTSSSSSSCSASYSSSTSSSTHTSIQQPRRTAAAAIRTRKVNGETSLITSKGPHSRRRRSCVVVRAGKLYFLTFVWPFSMFWSCSGMCVYVFRSLSLFFLWLSSFWASVLLHGVIYRQVVVEKQPYTPFSLRFLPL